MDDTIAYLKNMSARLNPDMPSRVDDLKARIPAALFICFTNKVFFKLHDAAIEENCWFIDVQLILDQLAGGRRVSILSRNYLHNAVVCSLTQIKRKLREWPTQAELEDYMTLMFDFTRLGEDIKAILAAELVRMMMGRYIQYVEPVENIRGRRIRLVELVD